MGAVGVVRLLPTWSLGGVLCPVRVCCFPWFTNVQIVRPSAAVDPSALFPSIAPRSQLSRSWCDMKISRLVPSVAQLGLGSSSTSLRLVLKNQRRCPHSRNFDSEEVAVCLPCLCQCWPTKEQWSVLRCGCLFSLVCSFLWYANGLNNWWFCRLMHLGKSTTQLLPVLPPSRTRPPALVTQRPGYDLRGTVRTCYKNISFLMEQLNGPPKEGSAWPEFFSTCRNSGWGWPEAGLQATVAEQCKGRMLFAKSAAQELLSRTCVRSGR